MVAAALVTILICLAAAEYSSIDGSGNNLIDPSVGASGTRFSRKLGLSFYTDSKGEAAIEPNARLISNRLFGAGPMRYNSAQVAFTAAAWGEIEVHLT